MNTITLHSSNSFQDSLYVVGVVLYTTDKGTATCRPRVAGEPFVWTDKTELKSKLRPHWTLWPGSPNWSEQTK